jgi:hypothetical protein
MLKCRLPFLTILGNLYQGMGKDEKFWKRFESDQPKRAYLQLVQLMDLYKDVAMKLKPHVPPDLLEPFNVVEVLVSVQQVMTPLGFNPDIVDQETTGKPSVCARIECCNTTKLKVSQL